MNKNSFLKLTLLLSAFIAVFFVSCDNDFNELGTDIVGLDNYDYERKSDYDVIAQNVDIGAVETTDLPINPLGVYENPVYGTTTASFVTQLQMQTINPTIDLTKNPEIISVVMRVPYLYTSGSADAAGNPTYTLDSIYGPETYSKMKLKVYESGYTMRDLDPFTQLAQAYYSNQKADFESALIGGPLNNYISDVTQNEQFVFSKSATEVTTYEYVAGSATSDSTKTAAAPAMKIYLNKEYFKQKILNAPAGKLLNNNVFKEYFRGLYIKLEKDTEEGNMAMLDFRKGIITINYKYTTRNDDDEITNIEYKNIVLTMTGKSASLIDQAPKNVPADASKLFLKGGANNSMAVIDIFNETQLTELRNGNILINDAILTFNIDKSSMTGAVEPLRVYLYDFNNKRAILDHTLDYSTSTKSTKLSKKLYGGIIQKDADGRGVKYAIRLTKHMIQMVKLDSTNVRLGLVVTEDINTTVPINKKVRTPQLGGKLKEIPTMAAAHPLGTILYGSNIPVGDPNYDKRPKLEIYYTKPK